jgi:hypothetical protein
VSAGLRLGDVASADAGRSVKWSLPFAICPASLYAIKYSATDVTSQPRPQPRAAARDAVRHHHANHPVQVTAIRGNTRRPFTMPASVTGVLIDHRMPSQQRSALLRVKRCRRVRSTAAPV